MGEAVADDRMAEGVEHLQTAALELIAAARAFLDVAEDLVTDPDRVSGTLATVATLVDGAGRASARRRAEEGGGSGESGKGSTSEGAPASPLRRIDVF
jgi:hypothetical protein